MEVPAIYSNQELKNLTNSFTKSFVLNPAFVGVVNLTKDSFSDGGKFDYVCDAVKQITKLISDGASVIELGAQSTRPNAEIVGEEEEYNKLNEVLVNISDLIKEKNIQISIDSFWPSAVLNLIRKQHKISIVNDVKGEFDDRALAEISESKCKFCIMHSLTAPVNPEIILPQEADVIDVLEKWGRSVLDKLYKIGFSENDVIIDPGIGFGKSAYQNIKILKEIEKLKRLKAPIMVGHSRKSYIKTFSNFEAKDRDIETIAVSACLYKKVDFLRVHNVEDHMRFLAGYEVFS
jgi:2-amino-4-hydroxy-6-hydroxymethyldihydropteridine diphosphokinase/dihydropteroate synthase